MKKLAFLTSRTGGMIKKLTMRGIDGIVYSNNPKLKEKLEEYVPSTLYRIDGGFNLIPRYFKELSEIPNSYDIYLLCGFMRIIPKIWLEGKKVINYHPGKRGYEGKDPQERMLRGYREGRLESAGGIIHFVDSGVDVGEVIYEFSENIQLNDDVKSLTERMEVKAVDFLAKYLR